MLVRAFSNGDLLAPTIVNSPGEEIGYDRVRVERGTVDYDRWIAWLQKSGAEPVAMDEEEEAAAIAELEDPSGLVQADPPAKPKAPRVGKRPPQIRRQGRRA